MNIPKYRFTAECSGMPVLLSEKEQEAVGKICGILNGMPLDSVEAILRRIKNGYSEATFNCVPCIETESIAEATAREVHDNIYREFSNLKHPKNGPTEEA